MIAGIRVIDYDDLSRLDGAVYGFGEMFTPIREKNKLIETVKEEKKQLELNLADTYSRMKRLTEENEELKGGKAKEVEDLKVRVKELEQRPTQHELDEIVKEKEKLDELFLSLIHI